MSGFLKSLMFIVMLLCAPMAFAASGVTYQGRIIKPNGDALEGSNVQFRVQVRTPGNENCLMFEEATSLDMRDSKGLFGLVIGTGTRTDSSGYGLDAIFANRGSFTFAGSTCVSGSSYAPNPDDGRNLVVYFKDETMTAWEPMPTTSINYVPFAFEAKQIAGFSANSLVRVADGATLGNVSPLSTANYNALLALIAGTSSQYQQYGKLQGVNLPASFSNGQVLGWSGGAWSAVDPLAGLPTFARTALPTCAAGEFLRENGAGALVCTTPANSGGTVTAVVAGAGLTGGTITTTGTIALPVLGAGGTAVKVTYDTFGRITAAGSLAEADIPTLVTAGKVSGNAINTGTIGGNAAVNTTGNLATTGLVSAGSVSATGDVSGDSITTKSIRVFETTNNFKVTIVAPGSLGADYTMTLPGHGGAPGQVLTTDGAGSLTWSNTAVTGITSLTGDVTASGTGAVSATLSNTGVTSGTYGSSSSVPTFTVDSKGRLTAAGSVTISGTAPGGAAGGDLAGTYPNPTVARIQGMNVNAGTLGPADAGKVFVWQGTEYQSQWFGVHSLKSSTGVNQFASATCTSSQTLTWSALTDTFTCVDIAGLNASVITSGTLSASVLPIVPVAKGGTNSPTALFNNRIMITSGGAVIEAPALLDGQLLIGQTGGAPIPGTLTAGPGISITNGAGSITISASGAGAALNNGRILVGNSSNIATEVVPTGDATLSNTGNVVITANAVTTTKIADDQVTFAKLQNINTSRMLGRSTAGAGDVEEIALGAGLALVNGTLAASGSGTSLQDGRILLGDSSNIAQQVVMTGDVTINNAGATVITANAITGAELAADAVTTAKIADQNVTFAKFQNVNTSRIFGRSTAGAGVMEEIQLGTGLVLANGTLASTSLGAVAGSTLSNARIWVGNGSNAATEVLVSGDATMSNAGVFTIGANAVTTSKVADDAISFAKLQNVNTNRLLGRSTAASGDVEEIQLGGGITLSQGTLSLVVGGGLAITNGTLAATGGGGDFYRDGSVSMTGQLQAIGGSSLAPGYTFAGDTDIGMYRVAANTLGFATGGQERMVIDSNGNVGIGISRPTTPLDVQGDVTVGVVGAGTDIRMRRADGVISGHIEVGNGMQIKEQSGGGWISFWTNGGTTTEKVRITANGDVGIGTTTPLTQLHVTGGAIAAGTTGSGAGNGGQVRFYDLGASGNNFVAFRAPDSIVSNVSWTLPATDGSSGYALITNGSGSLAWQSMGGGGDFFRSGSASMTGNFLATHGSAGVPGVAFSHDIDTGLFNAGVNTLAFTAGGTATASLSVSGLDVLGQIRTADDIYGARFFGGSVWLNNGGSIQWGNNNGVSGNGISNYVSTFTNGVERTRIDQNGNFGVGVAAPTSRLDVRGGAIAAGSQSSTLGGEVRFHEVGTATGYNYVAFRAPTALAADVTWTLPAADGGSGTVLQTNGSGSLTWVSMGGGGDFFRNGSTSMTGNFLAAHGSSLTPGIAFSHDTDTGLYSVGANTLAFATGGQTRMVIDPTGNIGLGTMTPTADIHIASDAAPPVILLSQQVASVFGSSRVAFGNDIGNSAFFTYGNSTYAAWGGRNAMSYVITGTIASPHTWWSNNTERMRIDDNGNLLVGANSTLSTANRLEVIGGAIAAGSQSGAGGEVRFNEMSTASGNNYVALRAPTALGSTTTWVLPSGDGGSGNVLSTNGAGSLTWVAAGGGGDFLRNGSLSMTGQLQAITGSSLAPSYTFAGATDLGMYRSGASEISFVTNGQQRLTIDSGGQVGIGTTIPQVELAIQASAPRIGFFDTDNALSPTNPNWVARAYDNTGRFSIQSSTMTNYSAQVERFTILHDGKVGIGTSAPLTNFQVGDTTGGNIRFATSGGYNVAEYYQNESQPRWYLSRDATAGGVPGMVFRVSGTVAANGAAISQPSTSDLAFFTSDGVNLAERMRFTGTTGQLGIGTVAPYSGSKVHVTGGALSVGSMGSGAGNGGQVRLYDLGSSGNNYVAFRAPDSIASDVVWTLPATDGGSGSVLQTNGSGSLTWVAMGGGGDFFRNGSVSMTGNFLAAHGSSLTPGVAFSHDTDTGMYNTGANTLAFATNGQQRLVIDSSGNSRFVSTGSGGARFEASGSHNALPATSGSTPNALARIGSTAAAVAIDFGAYSAGGAWIQSSNTNNLGLAMPLLINPRNNAQVGIGLIDGPLTGNKLEVAGGAIAAGSIGSGAGNAGQVRWYDLGSSGNNYVAFRAPDSIASDVVFTLPASLGTLNQVLTTDAAGSLSWTTVSGGGGGGDFYRNGSATMTGQLVLAVGTNSAPSLTFAGDNDTGLYQYTPNSFSVATNGQERIRFSNNGAQSTQVGSWNLSGGVSAAFPSYAFENDTDTGMYRMGPNTLSFATAGVDRLVVDGSGNVGIGTTTPSFPLHLVNHSSNVIGMDMYNDLVSNGPLFLGRRAFDNSGAPEAVGNGAFLATFGGRGYGTTGWSTTSNAAMIIVTEEAHTDTAKATGVAWKVTPGGTNVSVEVMRLSSSGALGVGALAPFAGTRIHAAGGAIAAGAVGAGAGNGGQVRFYDLGSSGDNYVAFRAPDQITNDIVWTLPASSGTANQVLQTNGSNSLTWATLSGGGDFFRDGSVSMTGALKIWNGASAANPGLQFASDPGTGIWTSGASSMNLTAGGSNILSVNALGTTLFTGQALIPSGTASAPSLAFSSDTDTGIYNTGSNSLSFATGGSNRMTIDGNGYVGIGTTTPQNVTAGRNYLSIQGSSDMGMIDLSTGSNGDVNGTIVGGIQMTDRNSVAADKRLSQIQTILSGATGNNRGGNLRFMTKPNGASGLSTRLSIEEDGSVMVGNLSGYSGAKLTVHGAIAAGSIGSGAGNAAQFRWYDLGSSGMNHVAFRAPDNVINDTLYTLPANSGTVGQVLSLQAANSLSWTTIAGGGDFLRNGTVSMTGSFLAAHGSSLTPGISFSHDTDTGFYNFGGGVMYATSNTFPVFSFFTSKNRSLVDLDVSRDVATAYTTTSGALTAPAGPKLTIENNSATNGAAAVLNLQANDSTGSQGSAYIAGVGVNNESAAALVFGQKTGGSSYAETMRLSPAGSLGLGTSSPVAKLDVVGASTLAQDLIRIASSGEPNLNITGAHAYSYLNPSINFNRSRGSLGSRTVPGTGDDLGSIWANSWEGTYYAPAARIEMSADAGHGSGDTPGRITFSTTQDGTVAITERMRINNTGNVLIGSGNLMNGSNRVEISGGAIAAGSIGSGTGNGGQVRFYDLGSSGNNYVSFRAPDQITLDAIYTLPANTGTVGQVLTTQAGNSLSWTTVAGGGGSWAADASNTAATSGLLTSNAGTYTINNVSISSASYTGLKLHTKHTGANISGGTVISLDNTSDITSGNNISNWIGQNNRIAMGANVVGSVVGESNAITLTTSGAVTGVANQTNSIVFSGASGATGLTGASYSISSTSNANVTTATGIAVAPLSRSGSGLINTYYGLFLGAGTAATTSWGIYQLGSNNYLNGTTGIGTSTIQSGNKLEVQLGAIAAGSTGSGAGNGGQVRFYETASGNNYVALRAPDTLASNVSWYLPTGDGGANQVLRTNGSGSLSWGAAGGDFFRNGSVSMTGNFLAAHGSSLTPGISFSHDTDTGMFNAGANTLAFSTGGQRRMAIDSGGRVTVGSTATNSGGFYVEGKSWLMNSTMLNTDATLTDDVNFWVGTDVAPTASLVGKQRTGLVVSTNTSGTQNLGKVMGSNMTAYNGATAGSIGTLTASASYALNWGGGNAQTVIGADLFAESDAGAVGNMAAANIWTGIYGGTITNWDGLKIYMSSGGGAVTSRAAINIAGMQGSATNDYAIFSQASQRSSIAGSVGIGTQTLLTGNKLEVKGGAIAAGSTSSTVGGEVRFYEASTGADYVAFRAPANLAQTTTWTLPANTGTSNQVLTVNGAGSMTWAAPTSKSLLIASGASGTIPAGATYNFGFTTMGAIPVPEPGTITKLYLRTSAAQPGDGGMVCVLRVNGSNSSLSVSISAGALAGTFSDTTNSASVAAGDLVDVSCTNNSPGTSANRPHGATMVYQF